MGRTTATIKHADTTIEEYRRGWRDCRTYAGEDRDGSAAYMEGFLDCLRAYHAARNWIDVPAEGER